MKKSIVFASIVLAVCFCLCSNPLHAQEGFVSAQVKDISGRAYEPAVIELIDNANKSIDISMYTISLGTKYRNPIRLLLNDLVEARQRDVKVTMYLNTRFRGKGGSDLRFIGSPELKELEDAGCIIHLISKSKRLHDKLIIVDSRYVVEGSTNWSISALRSNFESATLIDSRELAKVKLQRLKFLITYTKSQLKEPTKSLYITDIAETVDIPALLFLDKKYFPQMTTRHDKRSMDLYLTLLAHAQSKKKSEFFIDLESMGLSLGMPDTWSDSAIRRQVIKSLRKLNSRYELINVSFIYSKDAWVELVDISGDTFKIKSSKLKLDSENRPSMRVNFLRMIEAFLKSNGEDLESYSTKDLAERFYVHPDTIRDGLKEMRE